MGKSGLLTWKKTSRLWFLRQLLLKGLSRVQGAHSGKPTFAHPFFFSPLGAAVWHGLKTVPPSLPGRVERCRGADSRVPAAVSQDGSTAPRERAGCAPGGLSLRNITLSARLGRGRGPRPHGAQDRNACLPLNTSETDFQASNSTEESVGEEEHSSKAPPSARQHVPTPAAENRVGTDSPKCRTPPQTFASWCRTGPS